MKKVLRLHTSLFQDNSVSSQLVQELTQSLAEHGEALDIVDRDFRESPVPHLDAERLQALSTAKEERSAKQAALVAYSDSLIEEVQKADVLLIALPMYNFSVPSMFKAWFDHVARAGVTFAYTDQGPKGLLTGKKAYLVSAMGGNHEPGQTDFMRPYVKLLMNFIGIEDLEFVTARGLNMGDDAREHGIAEARADIERLAIEFSGNHQPTEEVAA